MSTEGTENTNFHKTVRKPPRTHTVGSMIRPAPLLAAIAKVIPNREAVGHEDEAHPEDREALRAATDDAIKDVVQKQIDVGLDVVTDGEFRRYLYYMSIWDALDGFSLDRELLTFRNDAGESRVVPVPRINGKVRKTSSPVTAEAEFLASITDHPFKITLPAGSRELMYSGRPVLGPEVYATGAYDNAEDAFADLMAVERELIDEAVAAGAPSIQLDYPLFTHVVDPAWAALYRNGGVEIDQLIGRALEIDNALVAGLPDHVQTAIHFCRGNFGDKWVAGGALDPVAEQVFSELDYDVLLIEWSDPKRHGGFESLRFLPDGKIAVLGIVDTKSTEIETEDDLLRKIEEAAQFTDVSNLAVSPQCGFSSNVGINPAVEEQQWAKLDVMCRVAEKVWGGS